MRTPAVVISTAIGLAPMIAIAAWLTNGPPPADCGAEGGVDSRSGEVRATKVVVEPWYGPHHVYGLFVVPDQYGDPKYSETVTVHNFRREFVRKRIRKLHRIDDVTAPPGAYVRRAYVPTRVALWFLVTGRLGDLRTACRWTLVFIGGNPHMRASRSRAGG
jgi:hypothetical protein